MDDIEQGKSIKQATQIDKKMGLSYKVQVVVTPDNEITRKNMLECELYTDRVEKEFNDVGFFALLAGSDTSTGGLCMGELDPMDMAKVLWSALPEDFFKDLMKRMDLIFIANALKKRLSEHVPGFGMDVNP